MAYDDGKDPWSDDASGASGTPALRRGLAKHTPAVTFRVPREESSEVRVKPEKPTPRQTPPGAAPTAPSSGGGPSIGLFDDPLPPSSRQGAGGKRSSSDPAPSSPVESPPDDEDGAIAPPSEKVDATAMPAELFQRAGTFKVGILGGKQSGKSYLFQAMVYRTSDGARSGVLSYYLKGGNTGVMEKRNHHDACARDPMEFNNAYRAWLRLEATKGTDKMWYKLRLRYRAGLLGFARRTLDVQFFDGAGEELSGTANPDTDTEYFEMWRDAFLEARVLVFCLPIWAAFPASNRSSPADRPKHRSRVIEDFRATVTNLSVMREKYGFTHPVRTILALTMADDSGCALQRITERWLTPFAAPGDQPSLRTGAGVARYLATARQISECLREEFSSCRDNAISGIPGMLNFGGGAPWIAPVSAIDGATLSRLEEEYPAGTSRPPLEPPVPVHVELPLLVALCERDNALM